jgi:hypothetical protein
MSGARIESTGAASTAAGAQRTPMHKAPAPTSAGA